MTDWCLGWWKVKYDQDDHTEMDRRHSDVVRSRRSKSNDDKLMTVDRNNWRRFVGVTTPSLQSLLTTGVEEGVHIKASEHTYA